jgi:hypothetical protein
MDIQFYNSIFAPRTFLLGILNGSIKLSDDTDVLMPLWFDKKDKNGITFVKRLPRDIITDNYVILLKTIQTLNLSCILSPNTYAI